MPLPAFQILQDTIEWQKDIWNRISWRYLQEIDPKFQPVTDEVVRTAALQPGEQVLDLGCGTGAVTLDAARAVLPGGSVLATDISAQMLLIARMRLGSYANVRFELSRAAEIPAATGSQDVVISSLVLMFAINKEAAAREIARVLRRGGRMVASVWAKSEECEVARFQKTIGKFAPPPPTRGVGPTSLGDPTKLMMLLAKRGIASTYHSKVVEWAHPNFEDAWETFAIVTSLRMSPEQIAKAKAHVLKEMWGGKDGPRTFRNRVHYIVGRKKS
jgi:ubiquinone/menaquinone biosynthesis C-methylase UbiE